MCVFADDHILMEDEEAILELGRSRTYFCRFGAKSHLGEKYLTVSDWHCQTIVVRMTFLHGCHSTNSIKN